MSNQATPREKWSGKVGFILAAAGSAIGLGNIWKFPYIVGENGGGAFVLVYLLCITAIGMPVMLCEFALGRRTQLSPVGAFRALAPKASLLIHLLGLGVLTAGAFALMFRCWGWGALLVLLGILIFRFGWVLVGISGVVAGFTILSFYSVVAGWTIGYIWKAAVNQLHFATVAEAQAHFTAFILNPAWAIGCHFIFMLLCVLIVYKGVQSGIERWSKILMPLLFLIIFALIIRNLTLPGAMEGVRFYLTPDFSKITTGSVLTALGQAFFSLSLGMGVMVTYGSYLDRDKSLVSSTVAVVGLDTLVALMAGLAIFPAVFAQGFDPAAGPGLVLQVLPTVFLQIPLGIFWAFLFFILLLIAALTSGISLLEVVTAYFVDERHWTRPRATVVFGTAIFLLGCLCAISVADWSRLEWIHVLLIKIFGAAKPSFFDTMDNLSSNWLLPLGGLFIAVFTGWVWGTQYALEEIRQGSSTFDHVHLIHLMAGMREPPSAAAGKPVLTLAAFWGIFIRFISPVAILFAFLHTIGWLNLT